MKFPPSPTRIDPNYIVAMFTCCGLSSQVILFANVCVTTKIGGSVHSQCRVEEHMAEALIIDWQTPITSALFLKDEHSNALKSWKHGL